MKPPTRWKTKNSKNNKNNKKYEKTKILNK